MTPAQAETSTRRAVRLARTAADRGNLTNARAAWRLACFLASKMGGLTGHDNRYDAILFPGGAVSWAPSALRRP